MSLAEAFRAEFKRIIETDEFSFKTCLQLERLARSAKESLLAVNMVGVKTAVDAIDGDLPTSVMMSPVGDLSAYQTIGSLSPAPASETFGVKVIQEALATLPELFKRFEKKPVPPKPEDPLSLVRAIKEARDAGMDKIATALEQRLRRSTGDAFEDESPAPVVEQAKASVDIGFDDLEVQP